MKFKHTKLVALVLVMVLALTACLSVAFADPDTDEPGNDTAVTSTEGSESTNDEVGYVNDEASEVETAGETENPADAENENVPVADPKDDIDAKLRKATTRYLIVGGVIVVLGIGVWVLSKKAKKR